MAFDGCNDLTNVYYGGTAEDWKKISIGSSNKPLVYSIISYIPSLKVTEDGNGITVIPKNVDDNGVIIVVSYKSGELVEMKTAEYSGAPIEIELTRDFDTYKVMLWNSLNEMKPLAPAK